MRPTSDHLKKEILKLTTDLNLNSVWDLFAGSGGVGLEFLSQGSESVVFVEELRKATDSLTLNISECRLKNPEFFARQKVTVVCTTVMGFLKNPSVHGVNEKPSFVFMDPPYGQGFFKNLPRLLSECPLLDSSTIFLAEHVADEDLTNSHIKILRQQTFGPKQLTVFSFKI